MKFTIVGGGNMGGSIAKGLVSGTICKPEDIQVIDINEAVLIELKKELPGIKVNVSNYDDVAKSDIVILAVKPWLVEDVIIDIKFKLNYEKQILVSIAAGVSIEKIEKLLMKMSDQYSLPPLFRVIPNTAISVGESMTLIATNNATDAQKELILKMFRTMGEVYLMNEMNLSASTALTSCGIAFFFRFVRAAMLAGTELGIPPKDAQKMLAYTMKGAADLLLKTGVNPEDEIDKVTTPGG
ncbi:MAG: pyrroline-5-carboxylate reductase, partial [Dysgonamonadaceae bacterium]|nr:pyrroline-5-carboxylate reductase [Dysgonamonadaceae bacterium]